MALDTLLLEDGSALLLEDGGRLLLESATEDASAVTGGTWRRALPTWSRATRRAPDTLRRRTARALPTWSRTWRYSKMLATETGDALVAAVSDDRDYLFDLRSCPEIGAGATISSAAITGGSGLTKGAPAVLSVATDGVPAGKGVSVRISGGSAGTTYPLALVATLSTGRVVVVPGRLVKVADFDS